MLRGLSTQLTGERQHLLGGKDVSLVLTVSVITRKT